MKILLVADYYFHYALAVSDALKSYGHNVKIAYTKQFNRNELSNIEYVKYKINKSKYIKHFIDKQVEYIKRKSKENIDMFISINGNYYNCIDKSILSDMKSRGIRTIAWYMDSIKRSENISQHLECYDKIFSFESDDIQYISNKYNLKIEYLPIGVYEKLFSSGVVSDTKKYDLCFVGFPTEKRLKYLEAVSKYCYFNHKKLIVYGYYWENVNFIREYFSKRKFAKKYPYLSKYAINKLIFNGNLAKLYNNSRICLNIHIEVHHGINPRTFEILANGNFELCDARDNSESMGLVDKENIVFYNSVDDCVEKIDYYLNHQQECVRIGKNGMDLVNKRYGMKEIVKKLLQ